MPTITVSDHKDTKFWNQFTTYTGKTISLINCFRPQRYKILKPIHNAIVIVILQNLTVSDHKDTKFWNQFTTPKTKTLFCLKLFQTTKIQNFETNSQQLRNKQNHGKDCFRPQRYKILKPIHNGLEIHIILHLTVSDHKDTKFWNQFTTKQSYFSIWDELFQTTKIQNFETNSQQTNGEKLYPFYCFRPQRYKILKPIHNAFQSASYDFCTVSDHKDTKFWNQFTTIVLKHWTKLLLFQTTKIQNFETNSQQ